MDQQIKPDLILGDDGNINRGAAVSEMNHIRPKGINFPTVTATKHHRHLPLSGNEVEIATMNGPFHNMVNSYIFSQCLVCSYIKTIEAKPNKNMYNFNYCFLGNVEVAS